MSNLIGLRVFVYYNSRKRCWSVKDVDTNKVVASVDNITLRHPMYKVSEAGRKRVLREGRKNVHAGIEGVVVHSLEEDSLRLQRVTYNPKRNKSFVSSRTWTPIHSSDYAILQFPYVYAVWRHI